MLPQMNYHDRIRLSAATGFSLLVISKWDQRVHVARSTEQALDEAAVKLGLTEERGKVYPRKCGTK